MSNLNSLGKTEEGRDILALRIAPKPGQSKRFLLVGCHHAREWISVEVPFLIAGKLLEESENELVKSILAAAEIWVIPMLNPDGHSYSMRDATVIGAPRPREWRKNRRRNADGSFGVDLNRNYDIDWDGQGNSRIPSSRTYRGPAPFSEPETQAIRGLCQSNPFTGVISYHSYGLEFAYPFGFADAPCDSDCQAQLMELQTQASSMAGIAARVGGQRYSALQAVHHYDDAEISGDCADWVFRNTQAATITVELRPSFDDQIGFEIGPEFIDPTFQENWPAALSFMKFCLDKWNWS